MDHLRRLYFNIPTSILDAPDGVYGDIDALVSWLEGPHAPREIAAWERRQRLTLTGVIQNLEDEER